MEDDVDEDQEQGFDSDEMKELLSGRLYASLAEFHNRLEEESDAVAATDIIITALSINLGHMLGQLPPKSRKYALKTIRRIIDEQISEAAKISDLQNYGQIGHA